jgi:hypothetical protein
MIIEQQQILTTQNLAVLFSALNLTDALGDQLREMARQCFAWVCRRQQMKIDRHHARLIMVKNTAYAWRQMIFFLSLLPASGVSDFLGWAQRHYEEQSEEFRHRFRPALNGLLLVGEGGSLDESSQQGVEARRFVGWSNSGHWLLTS